MAFLSLSKSNSQGGFRPVVAPGVNKFRGGATPFLGAGKKKKPEEERERTFAETFAEKGELASRESLKEFMKLAAKTRGFLTGESQTQWARKAVEGRTQEALARTGADPRALTTQAYLGQMQRGGEMELQKGLASSLAERTQMMSKLAAKEAGLPIAMDELYSMLEEVKDPEKKKKPWEMDSDRSNPANWEWNEEKRKWKYVGEKETEE